MEYARKHWSPRDKRFTRGPHKSSVEAKEFIREEMAEFHSARSLRAGGATALLCAGVDPIITQLVGRWKSDGRLYRFQRHEKGHILHKRSSMRRSLRDTNGLQCCYCHRVCKNGTVCPRTRQVETMDGYVVCVQDGIRCAGLYWRLQHAHELRGRNGPVQIQQYD